MRVKFKTAIDAVSSLVIICGIPLFFLQQFFEDSRARVQTAIEYAQVLHSGNLSIARERLLEPWTRYNISMFSAAKPTNEVVSKFVLDVFKTSPQQVVSLVQISEFFDGVYFCVQAGACDEKVSTELIGEYGRQVWCLYQPAIRMGRKELSFSGFGRGLRYFSIKRGGCK